MLKLIFFLEEFLSGMFYIEPFGEKTPLSFSQPFSRLPLILLLTTCYFFELSIIINIADVPKNWKEIVHICDAKTTIQSSRPPTGHRHMFQDDFLSWASSLSSSPSSLSTSSTSSPGSSFRRRRDGKGSTCWNDPKLWPQLVKRPQGDQRWRVGKRENQK